MNRARLADLAFLAILASLSCSKSYSEGESSESAGKTLTAVVSTQEKALEPVPRAATPVRLPGELVPAPWLGEATLVVALGARETATIVAAGNGWLRWFSPGGVALGERLGAGAPQVLRTADIDGDGKDEVLFARLPLERLGQQHDYYRLDILGTRLRRT